MDDLTFRRYPVYAATVFVAFPTAMTARKFQVFSFAPIRAEDLEPEGQPGMAGDALTPLVEVVVALPSRLLGDGQTLVIDGQARPLDARRLLKLAAAGTPGLELASPSAETIADTLLAEAATS